MSKSSKQTAPYYIWGKNCEGWELLKHPNFHIIEELMPLESNESLHYHKIAQQFFYILEGKASFTLDQTKIDVGPNEGIQINPGVHHFIANNDKKPLRFLVISNPSHREDRINIADVKEVPSINPISTSLADELLSLTTSAVRKMSSIDDMVWERKSSPEKWSKKEILGHLIDSALNNHRRLILSENLDNYVFEGYDQNHWVRANQYHLKSHLKLIRQWQAVNELLSDAIEHISDQRLQKKVTEHNWDRIGMKKLASKEALTLKYVIQDYLFHTEHHLAQIYA